MHPSSKWPILFPLFVFSLAGCGERYEEKDITVTNIRNKSSDLPKKCNELLTEVIVYDIISPPVASRIYAYSNLAFFEALRAGYPATGSLLSSFKGFDTLTLPDQKRMDPSLAAVVAFMKVAYTLSFSKDSMKIAEKNLLNAFGKTGPAVLENSRKWGEEVADRILKRAATDNYKKTRGMPRYSVYGTEGKWQQTPPEYADATEPHWRLIQPFYIDSASAFRPPPPPPYDLSSKSTFFKEVLEVFQKRKNLTPLEDSIARFWDDNPFVTEHRGHLTFANKKITPVGHWMGIIGTLSDQTQKDERTTALAYALGAAAIFDGFISCWEEKYHSERIRPATVIREQLESEWEPVLQTPSFPEYTSGHSVISAAAAVTLEHIFGTETSFIDSTEMKYLGMSRSFPSIMAAADEAGISRLYGGIHFRSAITEGKKQGASIGRIYCQLFDHVYLP